MNWKKTAIELVPESKRSFEEEDSYSATLFIIEYLLDEFRDRVRKRDNDYLDSVLEFVDALMDSGDDLLWNAAYVSFYERFLSGLDKESSKFAFKRVKSKTIENHWYLSGVKEHNSW